MKTHADGSILAHRFEASGLGKAPFSFIGCREDVIGYPDGTSQAAGTCQHCGTGIRYVFLVKSSCGKISGVGCDCIRHYGDDSRLVVVVESEMRKMVKASKKAKAEAKRHTLVGEYNIALTTLASLPHPNGYFAGKGKTYAEYFTYLMPDPLQQHFNPERAVSLMRTAIKIANQK